MKKIFVWLLCALCFFSAFGCAKKDEYSTDYTGLYIDGVKELYYADENGNFVLPTPTVRNEKGEKCNLETVCNVTDSSNGAVGKENGMVQVETGVYRLTFSLKDYTYDCDKVRALLIAEDEREITLADFNTEDELSRICDQPKQNFGTNNGRAEWVESFEYMKGVLRLISGEGCDNTPSGDRDGRFITFDAPLALSSFSVIRVWMYVKSEHMFMRSNFGFGYGEAYSPDNFWLQPTKNTWIVHDISAATIKDRWTDHTGYIDRIYARSYMAMAGDEICIAKISYIPA